MFPPYREENLFLANNLRNFRIFIVMMEKGGANGNSIWWYVLKGPFCIYLERILACGIFSVAFEKRGNFRKKFKKFCSRIPRNPIKVNLYQKLPAIFSYTNILENESPESEKTKTKLWFCSQIKQNERKGKTYPTLKFVLTHGTEIREKRKKYFQFEIFL